MNTKPEHRLAIVCTHPIQYFSPVFVHLAQREDITVKVFYGWKGATQSTMDHGFGKEFVWDIPLLDGYEYEFVPNVAKVPSANQFRGIDLPSLPSRIIDWNADSILVYGWCYKAHMTALRFFKGRIPVYFRGDSTLLNRRNAIRSWIRLRFLRWVYGYVDYAFYVGTQNQRYFKAVGLSESQLFWAPHAIDNARFANGASLADSQKIREQYGIGNEDIAVLLPAKLESIKSPGLLLVAVSRLRKQNVHLLFAGSGPLEAELRAAQLRNTHFLGFQNQSEMPAVYKAADLVALPSLSETWGLAINEAMACSRAVLASDRVGAAIDLIRNRKNGWIFPANDGLALEATLREAVSLGRDGLCQYGMASKEIIDRWSIPIQVEAIARAVKQANATNENACAN